MPSKIVKVKPSSKASRGAHKEHGASGTSNHASSGRRRSSGVAQKISFGSSLKRFLQYDSPKAWVIKWGGLSPETPPLAPPVTPNLQANPCATLPSSQAIRRGHYHLLLPPHRPQPRPQKVRQRPELRALPEIGGLVISDLDHQVYSGQHHFKDFRLVFFKLQWRQKRSRPR